MLSAEALKDSNLALYIENKLCITTLHILGIVVRNPDHGV